MKAPKFKEFIVEEEIKPYRFVLIWYDDPEDPDEPEKTADKIIDEGKKLGCSGFKVDIDGAYSDIDEEGTRFIYDKDGKAFRVDENTLVFVRAPVTRRKYAQRNDAGSFFPKNTGAKMTEFEFRFFKQVAFSFGPTAFGPHGKLTRSLWDG